MRLIRHEPWHSGTDHICYSAIGAGIAIEWSGIGDLPWYFYAGTLLAAILIGMPGLLRRIARERAIRS